MLYPYYVADHFVSELFLLEERLSVRNDEINYNPNLTMEFVKKNQSKPLDWESITRLEFNKDRDNFLLNKYRQYVKDNIKEELAMVAYHPLNIDKYLSMGYKIGELDDIM